MQPDTRIELSFPNGLPGESSLDALADELVHMLPRADARPWAPFLPFKAGQPSPHSKIDLDDPESILEAVLEAVPKPPSPDEARRQASEKSASIFAAYKTLGEILQRHEATIQNRWAKKTKQQRLQILLKIWPGMPASHRPDFEALRNEPPDQRIQGTKFRDHYLYPHINQQDLSQPRLMALLLNSRGRHPPPTFAAADMQSFRMGFSTIAVLPCFISNHVMILNGVTTAEEYGKLVPCQVGTDAHTAMRTGRQFWPGEGLLVLEVQARIMKFLVDYCHQVLHEIPPADLVSDAYPIQPEPPLKSGNDASGFASLAVMAAEAPYRPPQQLDLARLEALLAAKMSAAEDHVWALREDPAYFAQLFREIKDHRHEVIKDTAGNLHSPTSGPREYVLWNRIMVSMLRDSFISVDAFTELHRQVQQLQALQSEHETEISAGKDLPADYLVALLRFRDFLERAAVEPIRMLRMVVFASPPMRKFFVRQAPKDPKSSIMMGITREGVKKTFDEANVFWLLMTLSENDTILAQVGLPRTMDELERVRQASPEADALISTHVDHVLGDLNVIAQCLGELEFYQPWEWTCQANSKKHTKEFDEEWMKWRDPCDEVLAALDELKSSAAGRLAEPSGGKFAYPSHKRRTRETVEALRAAERNLDAVWASIDGRLRSSASALARTAVGRFLSKPRLLRRTAEWVEPAATPSTDKKTVDYDADILNVSLSTLCLGHYEADSRAWRTQPRVKPKTKGVASAHHPPAVANVPEPVVVDPQPTFRVDARTLKVFRTIFFNADVTSTPGSVPWNDFLHAMVATGFRAEKLYGSVWQFSPTRLDVERSIHFHEPHPVAKIPFEVARRHGRRLTRAYGWSGAMFVLRDK